MIPKVKMPGKSQKYGKNFKKKKVLIFGKTIFFLKAIILNQMKIMIAHVIQSISETTCDQTSRFVKKLSRT